MKIKIKVKTGCSESKIGRMPDGVYVANLKSKPENNKANLELIGLIARHFGISHENVGITSGASSKIKIAEINY